MELYFGGAEAPTWRKHLAANDISRMGMNFTHLKRRLPKTKPWEAPRGTLLLYASEPEPDYADFVRTYADEFRWVLGAPGDDPTEWGWYDRWIPTWDGGDIDGLEQLCARYPMVTVPGSALNDQEEIGRAHV